MKTYICTEVVTYKASNKKGDEAATFALQLKHRLIKGTSPVTDLYRAIKDHCRLLDRKYPRTRALQTEFYRESKNNVKSQITIYSGDPTNMSGQPKAAVIYLAELAGEIDMDKSQRASIAFEPEEGGEI